MAEQASVQIDTGNGFTCELIGDKAAVAYIVELICHAPGEKWALCESARGARTIVWIDDYAQITEHDKLLK